MKWSTLSTTVTLVLTVYSCTSVLIRCIKKRNGTHFRGLRTHVVPHRYAVCVFMPFGPKVSYGCVHQRRRCGAHAALLLHPPSSITHTHTHSLTHSQLSAMVHRCAKRGSRWALLLTLVTQDKDPPAEPLKGHPPPQHMGVSVWASIRFVDERVLLFEGEIIRRQGKTNGTCVCVKCGSKLETFGLSVILYSPVDYRCSRRVDFFPFTNFSSIRLSWSSKACCCF